MAEDNLKETATKVGKNDYMFLDFFRVPAVAVDAERNIIYANDSFGNLVGRKKEQTIGVAIHSLIKAETSGVEAALTTGESTQIETWATIGDKRYYLEFEPTPLKDANGNIAGVIETIVERTSKRLALQAIHDLVAKAKAGELSARATVKVEGSYKPLIAGINDILDALINPLNVAAEYVDRISRGDIPPKITDNYNGDFNEIKNNLNNCIGAVNLMVADANMLVKAAVEGRLSTRADASKHEGDFKKIVEGVNATLNAVLLPVNEATACLQEMARGNLDVEMKGDYKGDHAVIKENMNTTLGP